MMVDYDIPMSGIGQGLVIVIRYFLGNLAYAYPKGFRLLSAVRTLVV